MATHDAVIEQPCSDEDLEAFLRFALIFYARGVLRRKDCTPEWEACARYVLKELIK